MSYQGTGEGKTVPRVGVVRFSDFVRDSGCNIRVTADGKTGTRAPPVTVQGNDALWETAQGPLRSPVLSPKRHLPPTQNRPPVSSSSPVSSQIPKVGQSSRRLFFADLGSALVTEPPRTSSLSRHKQTSAPLGDERRQSTLSTKQAALQQVAKRPSEQVLALPPAVEGHEVSQPRQVPVLQAKRSSKEPKGQKAKPDKTRYPREGSFPVLPVAESIADSISLKEPLARRPFAPGFSSFATSIPTSAEPAEPHDSSSTPMFQFTAPSLRRSPSAARMKSSSPPSPQLKQQLFQELFGSNMDAVHPQLQQPVRSAARISAESRAQQRQSMRRTRTFSGLRAVLPAETSRPALSIGVGAQVAESAAPRSTRSVSRLKTSRSNIAVARAREQQRQRQMLLQREKDERHLQQAAPQRFVYERQKNVSPGPDHRLVSQRAMLRGAVSAAVAALGLLSRSRSRLGLSTDSLATLPQTALIEEEQAHENEQERIELDKEVAVDVNLDADEMQRLEKEAREQDGQISALVAKIKTLYASVRALHSNRRVASRRHKEELMKAAKAAEQQLEKWQELYRKTRQEMSRLKKLDTQNRILKQNLEAASRRKSKIENEMGERLKKERERTDQLRSFYERKVEQLGGAARAASEAATDARSSVTEVIELRVERDALLQRLQRAEAQRAQGEEARKNLEELVTKLQQQASKITSGSTTKGAAAEKRRRASLESSLESSTPARSFVRSRKHTQSMPTLGTGKRRAERRRREGRPSGTPFTLESGVSAEADRERALGEKEADERRRTRRRTKRKEQKEQEEKKEGEESPKDKDSVRRKKATEELGESEQTEWSDLLEGGASSDDSDWTEEEYVGADGVRRRRRIRRHDKERRSQAEASTLSEVEEEESSLSSESDERHVQSASKLVPPSSQPSSRAQLEEEQSTEGPGTLKQSSELESTLDIQPSTAETLRGSESSELVGQLAPQVAAEIASLRKRAETATKLERTARLNEQRVLDLKKQLDQTSARNEDNTTRLQLLTQKLSAANGQLDELRRVERQHAQLARELAATRASSIDVSEAMRLTAAFRQCAQAFELIYQIGDILQPALCCRMCFRLLQHPVVLECGHCYCIECCDNAVLEYADEKNVADTLECPQCQNSVSSNFFPNPTLEHIVSRYQFWALSLADARKTMRLIRKGLSDAAKIDDEAQAIGAREQLENPDTGLPESEPTPTEYS